METLVLDGKTYVKASKAARQIGYTTDYVGQLCRSGKIDSHLIGRSWYVNFDELGSHRVDAKRTARVKAREQVRKTLAERRQEEAIKSPGKRYERHISYEDDQTELIPEIRKITVESEKIPQKTHKKEEKQPEQKYTIENKGEKIVMSGTLNVMDATDEALEDRETTVLRPQIIKVPKEKPKRRDTLAKISSEEEAAISQSSDGDISMNLSEKTNKIKAISPKPTGEISGEIESTFLNKLQEYEVGGTAADSGADTQPLEDNREEIGWDVSTGKKEVKYSLYVPATLVLSLLLASSGLLLQTTWNYTRDQGIEGETLETTYELNLATLRERLVSQVSSK